MGFLGLASVNAGKPCLIKLPKANPSTIRDTVLQQLANEWRLVRPRGALSVDT